MLFKMCVFFSCCWHTVWEARGERRKGEKERGKEGEEKQVGEGRQREQPRKAGGLLLVTHLPLPQCPLPSLPLPDTDRKWTLPPAWKPSGS